MADHEFHGTRLILRERCIRRHGYAMSAGRDVRCCRSQAGKRRGVQGLMHLRMEAAGLPGLRNAKTIKGGHVRRGQSNIWFS